MALEEAFRRADALVRLRNPPLGPEMDGFTAWLCAQGFAGVPLRRRLWQVAHFNSYLRRLGIKDARQVERSHGERFLSNHLRRCRCKDQPWRGALGTPRSVHSFIDYLSQESLLASSPSESPRPYQGLLEEYLGYLKCERNLAEATIKIHRRYLTPFLEDLGADANPGPRMHDLRHSFASRRLLQWYRDGRDLNPLLPALATYLGHIKVSSTQIYLRATAELLEEANERFLNNFRQHVSEKKDEER